MLAKPTAILNQDGSRYWRPNNTQAQLIKAGPFFLRTAKSEK
jgi:hypothetical protein